MRYFLSPLRNLALPPSLALLWFLSSPALAQTDYKEGFDKKDGKRSGASGQTIKLRGRTKDKLDIKIKRKETEREKADREAREREKADREAQKKGFTRPNELSAAQYADQEKAKIRKNQIEGYKKLIPTMTEDNDDDKQSKAQIYYRLAEEYWEESKFLRFRAMEKNNKEQEEWDKNCRKLKDNSKCPPAPQAELTHANAYRSNAISVYQKLLQKFPNYNRADEVMFILAFNLMESNKEQEAINLFQDLIKKHPKSRFIPDAYTAVGDFFFNSKGNKVQQAIINYSAALRESEARSGADAEMEQKISMKGVALRAKYMLGWCDFNVGEYEKSVTRFKEVIQLSIEYEKNKNSKVVLKNEALRDLVRVFSRMDSSKDAYDYFRSIMGPKYAYQATRQLGERYSTQGNYPLAIKTYQFLMKINPAGQDDDIGPDAPLFQNEVLRSAARFKAPEEIYKEVKSLMAYLETDAAWAKKWRDHKEVWPRALEAAEQTLLQYSTQYHQDAQKEKENPKRAEQFYEFAMKLYDEYLRYFSRTEMAYELRFFFAELLYRKAQLLAKGSKGSLPKEAQETYSRAAYQYDRVVSESKESSQQYKRQAAFSEILCYESLAGRTGGIELKGAGKKLEGLTKTADGKVTWKELELKEWDKRLLKAYERYLTLINDKEERLQSFFKTGAIYYSYKHYLKSMNIFSMMAKEFPQHELSRRAAFMILYSYEDLNEWAKLEETSRLFIEDKELTKNAKFKGEMYDMVIRSSYQRIFEESKEKKIDGLGLAERFLKYEEEFGKEGPWKNKKGFAISPRAPNALALSGEYYNKSKRIIRAIEVRERAVKVYPEATFVRQLYYDLGGHYEQIANYEMASRWYERYVYGEKEPGKADEEPKEEPKKGRSKAKKAKKPAPKKVAKRGAKGKKTDEKAEEAAKKLEIKQTNNAIFKSAIYRRGLGQIDHSVILYRDYIKRFPDEKDIPDVYLAIASIYEDSRNWDKVIASYQDYLDKYQDPKVASFLTSAVKKFQADLAKKGSQWVLDNIGSVKKEIVDNDKLIYAHARTAGAFRELKKNDEMLSRYMMVNALGSQMVKNKIASIMGQGPALESYAEAKFYISELRRESFLNIKFVGNSRQDKKVLQEIVKSGKELASDYIEVAKLGVPKWVLAAVFRLGEINHLFVDKLYAAPMPKDLPANLHPEYKAQLENFALPYEERALDAYEGVLKKSAELGLYNEWARLCEKRRGEIQKKKDQINPHTILSKRPDLYWITEADLAKINLASLGKQDAPKPPPADAPQPEKKGEDKKAEPSEGSDKTN